MHNPTIAILAASVAAWVFGAAWYMALGKPYQRALGLNPDDCKDKKMPLAPLLVCFLAELLMAFVFSRLLASLGVGDWIAGAASGFCIALGFIVPAVVVNNMFPGRNPRLSLIDGGHWVGVAVIQGAVLVALS